MSNSNPARQTPGSAISATPAATQVGRRRNAVDWILGMHGSFLSRLEALGGSTDHPRIKFIREVLHFLRVEEQVLFPAIPSEHNGSRSRLYLKASRELHGEVRAAAEEYLKNRYRSNEVADTLWRDFDAAVARMIAEDEAGILEYIAANRDSEALERLGDEMRRHLSAIQ